MRRSLADEIETLRTSSEVGNGLVTSVFEGVRVGERDLRGPSTEARDQFQAAADGAFRYQKQLDGLAGLTEADRITVNKIKQLQGVIHVDYALAHALLDLGRSREALAQAEAVRAPGTELSRLVRDLSARQSEKAGQAGLRLGREARRRQIVLWLVLLSTTVIGVVLGVVTLRWVEGPLVRLVTAAERFGGGDLRPVTTGHMPQEFQVLADAMRLMGERLRGIGGDVVGAADQIAGSASDLSAVSEQLAASSSEGSTALVEIAGGAQHP